MSTYCIICTENKCKGGSYNNVLIKLYYIPIGINILYEYRFCYIKL